MQIPTVEKCCCGCSLRTGSALIGILFFFSCLSQTITFSLQAQNAEANNDADNRPTYIASAVVAAVMLACSCLLLYGVQTERAGLLRPWLFIYAVLSCMSTIVFVVAAIVCFAHAEAGIGAAFLVVGFVYFVLYAYWLIVVYSYYLQLKDMQIPQPYGSQTMKTMP